MQILLVEDDDLVREVIAAGLDDLGFEVVEARVGEEALERVHLGLRPLMVVTDIDLGAGCSGIEMVDQIHDHVPLLPVVFVTGRLDRLWGRAPQEREAHLGKPFTRRQLVAAVQSVLSPMAPSGFALTPPVIAA